RVSILWSEWVRAASGHRSNALFITWERARTGMPNRTSAKSAKAVKAAGKVAPARAGGGKKGNKPPLMQRIPWLTVGAVVVLVALVGALAASLLPKYQEQAALRERQEHVRQLRESLGQQFAPTEQNQDPSTQIQGVAIQEYPAG